MRTVEEQVRNYGECSNCSNQDPGYGGWISKDWPGYWWCDDCVEDAPEDSVKAV